MLKSLGQWTSSPIKTRKIIPTKMTMMPPKPPSLHEGQGEHDDAMLTQQYQQSEAEHVEAEYVAQSLLKKLLIYYMFEI